MRALIFVYIIEFSSTPWLGVVPRLLSKIAGYVCGDRHLCQKVLLKWSSGSMIPLTVTW